MKENTVLHALMYIFKSQSQNQLALEHINTDLSSELSEAGFEKSVVNQAIQWIVDLSSDSEIKESELYNKLDQIGHGLRYYTPCERDIFGVECQSFLLRLEQRGILSPANRERVIAQTIALKDSGVDVHLLRWVIMMVLYNQPDEESRQLAEMLAIEEMDIQYN